MTVTIPNLTMPQIQGLSATQISLLSKEQIAAITHGKPDLFSQNSWAYQFLGKLNKEQIQAINPKSFSVFIWGSEQLPSSVYQALTATQIASLSASNLAYWGAKQFSLLSASQVAGLNLSGLSAKQLAVIPPSITASFNLAQLQQITSATFRGDQGVKYQNIAIFIGGLTATQKQALVQAEVASVRRAGGFMPATSGGRMLGSGFLAPLADPFTAPWFYIISEMIKNKVKNNPDPQLQFMGMGNGRPLQEDFENPGGPGDVRIIDPKANQFMNGGGGKGGQSTNVEGDAQSSLNVGNGNGFSQSGVKGVGGSGNGGDDGQEPYKKIKLNLEVIAIRKLQIQVIINGYIGQGNYAGLANYISQEPHTFDWRFTSGQLDRIIRNAPEIFLANLVNWRVRGLFAGLAISQEHLDAIINGGISGQGILWQIAGEELNLLSADSLRINQSQLNLLVSWGHNGYIALDNIASYAPHLLSTDGLRINQAQLNALISGGDFGHSALEGFARGVSNLFLATDLRINQAQLNALISEGDFGRSALEYIARNTPQLLSGLQISQTQLDRLIVEDEFGQGALINILRYAPHLLSTDGLRINQTQLNELISEGELGQRILRGILRFAPRLLNGLDIYLDQSLFYMFGLTNDPVVFNGLLNQLSQHTRTITLSNELLAEIFTQERFNGLIANSLGQGVLSILFANSGNRQILGQLLADNRDANLMFSSPHAFGIFEQVADSNRFGLIYNVIAGAQGGNYNLSPLAFATFAATPQGRRYLRWLGQNYPAVVASALGGISGSGLAAVFRTPHGAILMNELAGIDVIRSRLAGFDYAAVGNLFAGWGGVSMVNMVSAAIGGGRRGFLGSFIVHSNNLGSPRETTILAALSPFFMACLNLRPTMLLDLALSIPYVLNAITFASGVDLVGDQTNPVARLTLDAMRNVIDHPYINNGQEHTIFDEFSAQQISLISPMFISGLTWSQISNLPNNFFQAITPSQFRAILNVPNALAFQDGHFLMGNEHIQLIQPTVLVAALTGQSYSNGLQMLVAHQAVLTSNQINSLSQAGIRGFEVPRQGRILFDQSLLAVNIGGATPNPVINPAANPNQLIQGMAQLNAPSVTASAGPRLLNVSPPIMGNVITLALSG